MRLTKGMIAENGRSETCDTTEATVIRARALSFALFRK